MVLARRAFSRRRCTAEFLQYGSVQVVDTARSGCIPARGLHWTGRWADARG